MENEENQAGPDEIRHTQLGRILGEIVQREPAVVAGAWDCSKDPYQLVDIRDQSNNKPFLSVASKMRGMMVSDAHQQQRPVVQIVPAEKCGETNSRIVTAFTVGPERSGMVLEVHLRGDEAIDDGEKEQLNSLLNNVVNYCRSRFEPPSQKDAQIELNQVGTNGHDGNAKSDAIEENTSSETKFQIGFHEFSRYVEEVHRSIDPKETAVRVANATQYLFKCDRVSVVQKKGNRFQIIAVSGQPSVNQRSNVVKYLRNLTRAVLNSGESFWYPQRENPLPPQIEHPLNEYLTLSSTRTLSIVPVENKTPESDVPHPEQRIEKSNVIAGVVIEKFSESLDRQIVEPIIHQAMQPAASALRNAAAHKQLFLYPLWYWMGKSKIILAIRHLPKTISVLAIILAIALILILVPADFTVSGEGVLVPKERRNIFALVDGQVESIDVIHGQMVKKDQRLAKLENHQLEQKIVQLNGQINGLVERISMIDRGNTGPNSFTKAEKQQRALERLSLVSQKTGLQSQIANLEREKQLLTVTSPMDGQVVTWDVDEMLAGRPVQRGRILMEIANVEGEWELEVNLPDRRIGHVLSALKNSDSKLKVSFILAADPTAEFSGTVVNIAKSTVPDKDEGQTIKIDVELDSDEIDIRQVRTEVFAKIHCGRRSLGYVWLHDIGEFIQSKILFRFW